MKIDVNKFLEVDEKRAFNFVFEKLQHGCEEKFANKIYVNGGWLDDSNDELEEILVEGLKKHVDRIEQGGYTHDDIIDAVNFLVMLYNICEE